MPTLADAHAYTETGIAVLPVYAPNPDGSCTCPAGAACRNTGKHPFMGNQLYPRGVNDASNNPEIVTETFAERFGNLNIGVACGAISGGLMVQDIDDEEIAALLLAPEFGMAEKTLCDTSGRGLHIWMWTRGETKGRNLIRRDGGPIGELRGDGQYVVAPPSMHRNGKQYTWLSNAQMIVVDDAYTYIVGLLKSVGIELQEKTRYLDRISQLPNVEITRLMSLPLPEYLMDDEAIRRIARGPTRREGGRTNRSFDLSYLAHLLVERSRIARGERMEYEQVSSILKRIDTEVDGYGKYSDRPNADYYYMTLGLIAVLEDEDKQRDSMTAGPYTWNRQTSMLSYARARSDQPVASFLPIIEEELTVEVSEDEDPTRAFTLSCSQEDLEVKTVIRGDELDKLRRALADKLPSDFIVEADAWPHIWPAAQHFSKNTGSIRRRRSYARPGWIEEDGQYSFLLPGVDGAITATGIDKTHRFEDDKAPRKLLAYGARVRPITVPEDMETATASFLSVLECGKPEVTLPVLLQVLGGPLFSLGLSSSPPLVHVTGETGSYKTSFCTAVLNIFGTFGKTQPPESYRSTVNALEERLHYLKDLTLLIDNFVPGQLGAGNLTQLVHAYADGVGRSRLSASGTRRATSVPRGLWLSTGESIWGENVSVRARTLIVWIAQGDIDKDRLTKLQERAALGDLGLIGGSFVSWLAKKGLTQIQDMVERGKEEGRKFLDKYDIGSIHARPVESLANLVAVFRIVMSFLKEELPDAAGTFSRVGQEGFAALVESVKRDTEDASQLSPFNAMCEALRSGLAAGSVRFNGRGIKDDGVGNPMSRIVGWVDRANIYLHSDVTFGWLQEEKRRQGVTLTFNWNSFCDEALKHGGKNSVLTRISGLDGGRSAIRTTVIARLEVLGDESVTADDVTAEE